MNFLIITPRIPYPPYRGDKLKIYNIARRIAKNNKVAILTFSRERVEKETFAHFRDLGINLITVKLSVFTSLLNALFALFSETPLQVAWYKSNKFGAKLREIIKNFRPDVLYFHLIRTAQYVEYTNEYKNTKVIDYTDAVSLYLDRFHKIEKNIFKKIFLGIEKARVDKYEYIAQKFDALFICSDVDKKYLEDRGIKVNIKLLYNGIDTEYFIPDNTVYDENRIIFTGNMPYFPNYDAVIYFVNEIFPLILAKKPETKFYIVGQKPPGKVLALRSDNVIITGFVKDIKAEYLKSAVNIAPMRFGAGTLNKIIESIVLGIPVVASSMSVQGMPDQIKKYVFTADSPQEFADKTLSVLSDKDFRNSFIPEAKENVRNFLSWDILVKNFLEDLINIQNK